MKRGPTGEFLRISSAGGEVVRAFVPRPLPPDPPLQMDGDLQDLSDRALLALGRLDSVSGLLPDAQLFLYMYVRKEALLSSQIEGTTSSLSDLLLFEIREEPGAPLDDVREVSNYVTALDHGLRRVREGFPLSSRLLRDVHGILLRRGRGSEKDPGEFRRSQNWVGGTRPGNASYVPPPPHVVAEAMSDLDKFLNDRPRRTPVLLKAALAHVQFESIHPFLDGNGRLGRLLIPLLLSVEGVLRSPVLYLSLHFEAHRSEYYRQLQRVREQGDWEAWLRFFLEGVLATAEGAVKTARRLATLFRDDRRRIEALGRPAGSALRVHAVLEEHPVQTIARLAKATRLTVPTVTSSLLALARLGIVRELTGRARRRVFGYEPYLKVLREGTEE